MGRHVVDSRTVVSGLDSFCICGGLWLDGRCVYEGTFLGARWELGQAVREFGVAVRDSLPGWVRRVLRLSR